MGFQDEFARRQALRQAQGDRSDQGNNDGGGDRALSCHSRAGGNPDGAARADENAGKLDPRLRGDDTVENGVDENTVSGEPVEPRFSSDRGPSESQTSRSDTSSGRTDAPETPTPTTRHDGWLPELRVKFLEALARTGNVQAAAHYVQRSRQSAYDLKRRDTDFARGWLAALVLAREVAQDKLQERAIEGVEEEIFYHGEVVATRRRYDSRLLLAHLARLDKIAEQIPAQRGAARFGELLDAIAAGEDTAPLVATPTEDELATLAAEAEARQQPEAAGQEAAEFYEIRWPDDDGPPEYYRMSPEEAAEMERDVPGLTTKATGTADGAVINALVFHAQAVAEFRLGDAEKGKNL